MKQKQTSGFLFVFQNLEILYYMNDDAFENEVAMSLQMLQVNRTIQSYELTRNATII